MLVSTSLNPKASRCNINAAYKLSSLRAVKEAGEVVEVERFEKSTTYTSSFTLVSIAPDTL